MFVENIVKVAESMGASDIHLTAGKHPKIRVKGELIEYTEHPIFTQENMEKIYTEFNLDLGVLDREFGVDASANVSNSRLRLHFYKTLSGMSGTFRLISTEIPKFESLNLPSIVKEFIKINNGLIIVTGATGSGKSTTLASLIDFINHNQSKKIITVEDPIEYLYKEVKSNIEQRELGEHVQSFDKAIVQAMREDPDIMLVGELRDLETIQSALRMAETGHLVFGTLHTRGAAETFSRIIDIFPGNQQAEIRKQIANVTKGVIAQQLVLNKKTGKRVPLVEVLVMNSAARSIITSNSHLSQLKDNIHQNHLKLGSQTFIQSATHLIKEGLLEPTDVEDYFNDDEIKKIRSGLAGGRKF